MWSALQIVGVVDDSVAVVVDDADDDVATITRADRIDNQVDAVYTHGVYACVHVMSGGGGMVAQRIAWKPLCMRYWSPP